MFNRYWLDLSSIVLFIKEKLLKLILESASKEVSNIIDN
jgi:hypothetical protein